MNNIQDLAWGAADDRSRNWREIDPRRCEGPIPVECRSASCGTCWVGVLGGAEKLSDVAAREGKKIKEFGYIDTTEPKPLIRLACQAQTQGAVSIVIPPWNGVFGKYLRAQRAALESIEFRSHEDYRAGGYRSQRSQSLILTKSAKFSPLLYVLAAALLWSTGGLFIKWTTLSGLELSFYRSFFAMFVVAFFTRHEGFGLNRISVAASILYAVLLILFVLATKQTTAANAIFLQYTAPVYLLIFEPLFYKEKFRLRDLITVLVCVSGMTLFFVGKLRPEDVAGNLMALASGLCFALYFLLASAPKARDGESRLVGHLRQPASCRSHRTMGPCRHFQPWSLRCSGVVYLGVVQLGLSYLFTAAMARGVRSMDAGIIGYIEPVLNPVWVFLILGEKPSQWALLGGSIIILAVITHMFLMPGAN